MSRTAPLASVDPHESATRVFSGEPPTPAEVLSASGVGAPSSGGRFRILRLHARGGLGEVLLAHDDELHRDVALKEIQHPYAEDPVSRARFLREAEITGRLEHPGVVPVYGLGQYPDGRPFYAMRFIEGQSMLAALGRLHRGGRPGEPVLSLRQLLGHLIAVCQTIAFAHDRGIIHRDLKPDNVMLGAYGETLVVDWGLAKPFDQAEAKPESPAPLQPAAATATAAGEAIGTPPFMSPEQVTGRPALGPASDIYSLGATLYQLLTGELPFQGDDVGLMMIRVQLGELRRPRQVKPGVPAALEAICLKAMALRPANRYASARDLAADVERWLADEPVLAYREPLPARLARWGRRHQRVLAWTAALLLTAVLTLGFGLAAVERQRRATEEQRQQAVEARERAEAQSRLALRTLKSVVYDIQTRLDGVPATHQVRRDMLRTAIAGLKEVAASAAAAPQKDHNLAAAYLEIGDVFYEIGGTAAGEWTQEAQRHYEMGHALLAELASNSPGDAVVVRDLGVACNKLGDVRLRLGDAQAARAAHEEALGLARRLADSRPENGTAQRDLAVAYQKLGDAHVRLGDLPAAGEAFQQMLDISRKLVDAAPQDHDARRNLGVACTRRGDTLRGKGDLGAARVAYGEALALYRQCVSAEPGNATAQRDLSVACNNYGAVSLELDDAATARTALAEALAVRERLAAADPHSAQALRDLSVCYDQMGDLSLQEDNATAARTMYEKGMAISRQLAAADPHNAEAQRDLAVSCLKVGDVLLRQNELGPARAAYEEGRAIFRRRVAGAPAEEMSRSDLAVACESLGDVLLRGGDAKGAAAAHQEALDLRRKLTGAETDVALSYYKLGRCRQQDSAFAEAIACYESSLTLLARLEKEGRLPASSPARRWRWKVEEMLASCREQTAGTKAP